MRRCRCPRSSPASSSPPLGLEPTFELFGSVIAALALVVAALAFRTRPRPEPRVACARPALDTA